MSDIFRLVLPTPFPVGPVNAYVLKGSPQSGRRDSPGGRSDRPRSPAGRVTLVDPGPAYPPAREALKIGLEGLGLGLGDVDSIIITHPHIDHYGLADEIARLAGAEVVAHADAAPRLVAGIRVHGAEDKAALEAVLSRSGVPTGYAGGLFRMWAAADTLAAPVKVDRTVAEGDLIEAGEATWTVIATPGHSPGAMCLYDPAGRRLISGDHLLAEISSNAIMDFESAGSPGARMADDDAAAARNSAAGGSNSSALVRQKSLLIYIESLRKVEGLEVDRVFPGHGEPFGDHRAVIAGRMRHYQARMDAVEAVLRRLGPSPAFPVARDLFPEQAEPMGQFLALSEVLGHLDLLEAESRVKRAEADGRDLYSPAS